MVNFPFDARKLAKLLFPAKTIEVKQSAPVEQKTQAAAVTDTDGREYLLIAVTLMDSLFEALQHRVENEAQQERFKSLELSAPKHIKEPDSPPHINALVSKKNLPKSFYRFRAKNKDLCLSVRAAPSPPPR